MQQEPQPTEGDSLPQLPESAQYVAALQQLRLTDVQRSILLAHYKAPNCTTTAKQLAEAAGVKSWQTINSQYGRLGAELREALNYRAEGQQSYVIASFLPPGYQGNSEWLWVMHPQLAEALEQIGWVSTDSEAGTQQGCQT